MSSRNIDGTHKLQPEVNKAARHSGSRVVIASSEDDSVSSRELDTSYFPVQDGDSDSNPN